MHGYVNVSNCSEPFQYLYLSLILVCISTLLLFSFSVSFPYSSSSCMKILVDDDVDSFIAGECRVTLTRINHFSTAASSSFNLCLCWRKKPYQRKVLLNCIGWRPNTKEPISNNEKRIICGFMLELHSFEMEIWEWERQKIYRHSRLCFSFTCVQMQWDNFIFVGFFSVLVVGFRTTSLFHFKMKMNEEKSNNNTLSCAGL